MRLSRGPRAYPGSRRDCFDLSICASHGLQYAVRDRIVALAGRIVQEDIAVAKIDRNRRAFLANSFSLAAGAGIMALGLPPAPAYAQTAPKPIRRSERYEDSFITERKPFKWPGMQY